MPRPKNTPHNAGSLRQLAQTLKAKAKEFEALAADLETAAPGQSVQVAHQRAVNDGLVAIESMRLEVLKKINEGAFIVGEGSFKAGTSARPKGGR